MAKLALWTFLAGCGADAASTHYAITTSKGHEVVLTQNPWADDTIIGGEAAVGALAFERLRRTHPKAATALELGLGAFRAAVAVRNLKEAR